MDKLRLSTLLLGTLLFNIGCSEVEQPRSKRVASNQISHNTTIAKHELKELTGLRYKRISARKVIALSNTELLGELTTWAEEHPQADIESVIDYSLDVTTSQLHFTFDHCSGNPNEAYTAGKANCIGYAALFSACCEHLIQELDLSDWSTEHLVGKIYMNGEDAHQFFNSPFFKDHDYNRIYNSKTGSEFFVDASLKDYMGKGYVQPMR